jgi:hypothetical protein
MPGSEFASRIERIVRMLNGGEVLPVLDEFYRQDARFYENEYLFAEGPREARERQASFLDTCSHFEGLVDLVHADPGRGITVLHNRSRYAHEDYGSGSVNGVHVQYWEGDMIAREEYFSGERVEEMLSFWRQVGRSSR